MTISVIEILVCFVAGLLGGLVTYIAIKRDFSDDEFEKLQKWVSVAATAAEQYFPTSGDDEKKRYIAAVLDKYGINLNDIHVGAMLGAVQYDIEREELMLEIEEQEE